VLLKPVAVGVSQCWSRDRAGASHRRRFPRQYVSFAFTERLVEVGVDPSVGSVGDAYDNALAESQIGLYKTELTRPEGPWRGVEHVELETSTGSIGSTPRGRTRRFRI
jgi:transposase InsO family protein